MEGGAVDVGRGVECWWWVGGGGMVGGGKIRKGAQQAFYSEFVCSDGVFGAKVAHLLATAAPSLARSYRLC